MSSTDLLWGRVGETAVGKHATKSFLEALLNTFNSFLYKGGRLLFSIVLCRAGSCLVGTVRRLVGGPLLSRYRGTPLFCRHACATRLCLQNKDNKNNIT